MNDLQTFLTDCFAQSSRRIQEAAVIAGQTVYGTFGDPQLIPIMTRHGSQDQIVVSLQVSRTWFPGSVPSKVELVRTANGRKYFIQAVDDTHPVVFTFLLTDREV